MLFLYYTNSVLQHYQKKLTAGELPLNLSHPTPARLRDECLLVFKNRFVKKDEKTLRDFFGLPGDNGYEWIIDNWNIGKFKAVINYVNNPDIKTDEKNVEILAWLIDFQPRPYQSHINYEQLLERAQEENTDSKDDVSTFALESSSDHDRDEGTEQSEVINGDISAPGTSQNLESEEAEAYSQPNDRRTGTEMGSINHKTDIDESSTLTPVVDGKEKPSHSPGLRLIKPVILAVIAALPIVALLLLYFPDQLNTNTKDLKFYTAEMDRPKACMIWSVDHYEAIPCDHRYDDGDAIALDSVVLRKFRKIMNPETIGIDDKPNVWYVKQDNKVEFFTDSGMHPVNKKQMKPLTDRIYTYHVLPLRDSLTR